MHLEIARHGEQPLGLLRAHHQRELLRLLEVVDLGGEIVPPQRDAEQKPHPRHDPVAIADAQSALDQVQLEAADVVSCRRVRRAPQQRGEAPAAVDVASLRMAPQLAGSHILDHTPTQRADGGISAHGELLLSEVANTSSSSGRGSPPRYNRALNSLPTPPTAPPRSGYRGSDLVHCPDSDIGLVKKTLSRQRENLPAICMKSISAGSSALDIRTTSSSAAEFVHGRCSAVTEPVHHRVVLRQRLRNEGRGV